MYREFGRGGKQFGVCDCPCVQLTCQVGHKATLCWDWDALRNLLRYINGRLAQSVFGFISRCFYYILDQFDQETLLEMKFAMPRTWMADIGNYLSTLIFKFSVDFHNMQSVDVVSRAWYETERKYQYSSIHIFNILVLLNILVFFIPYIHFQHFEEKIVCLCT